MVSLGLGKLDPVDTLDNISEPTCIRGKLETDEKRLLNLYKILHWEIKRYDA
jgi:hypothetical protein